jgi:LPXTG-motif cell wall-anchored protein
MKLLAPLMTLAASPAFAQCVMCFRAAASQQAERAKVMNTGILVMGIPPFLILGGFLWLAWRRREPGGTGLQPVQEDQEAAPLSECSRSESR